MATEKFDEQLHRVTQMADDEMGLTWDLSRNDRAALQALLNEFGRFKTLALLIRQQAVTISKIESVVEIACESSYEAKAIFEELTQ